MVPTHTMHGVIGGIGRFFEHAAVDSKAHATVATTPTSRFCILGAHAVTHERAVDFALTGKRASHLVANLAVNPSGVRWPGACTPRGWCVVRLRRTFSVTVPSEMIVRGRSNMQWCA